MYFPASAVCKPGFGGFSSSGCTACGPRGYGPDAAGTACVNCPAQQVGFTFFYRGEPVPYLSLPVARTEASSSADCVSEFAQIQYGWWFLSGASTDIPTATDLAACVAACESQATCMFLTFTYTGDVNPSSPESRSGTCKTALATELSAGQTTQ